MNMWSRVPSSCTRSMMRDCSTDMARQYCMHSIASSLAIQLFAPGSTQGHKFDKVFLRDKKEQREVEDSRAINVIVMLAVFWLAADVQCRASLEIFEDLPDTEVLVTCCGGGGFLAGTSSAAKLLSPNCRIYGVEPETGAMHLVFRSCPHMHLTSPFVRFGFRNIIYGCYMVSLV